MLWILIERMIKWINFNFIKDQSQKCNRYIKGKYKGWYEKLETFN